MIIEAGLCSTAVGDFAQMVFNLNTFIDIVNDRVKQGPVGEGDWTAEYFYRTDFTIGQLMSDPVAWGGTGIGLVDLVLNRQVSIDIEIEQGTLSQLVMVVTIKQAGGLVGFDNAAVVGIDEHHH